MTTELDDDSLAEQLFEAARRDRPNEGVKRQALRAASARSQAWPKQRWWLAALAVGAFGVLLAVAARRKPQPESEFGGIRAESLQGTARPVRQHAIEPPVKVAPTSSAPRAMPAPTSKMVPRASAVTLPPASLEEELALLDAARQALLAGDPAGALSRLSRYDRVATRRQLGAEASVLRMQILAANGRTAEASALAREFVAEHPNSPLVDRAKSFVGTPPRGNDKEGVGP